MVFVPREPWLSQWWDWPDSWLAVSQAWVTQSCYALLILAWLSSRQRKLGSRCWFSWKSAVGARDSTGLVTSLVKCRASHHQQTFGKRWHKKHTDQYVCNVTSISKKNLKNLKNAESSLLEMQLYFNTVHQETHNLYIIAMTQSSIHMGTFQLLNCLLECQDSPRKTQYENIYWTCQ